jgi:parallel beta-helix repeat protein
MPQAAPATSWMIWDADGLSDELRLCRCQKQDQVVEPLEGNAMKNRICTLFLLVVTVSNSALTTSSPSAELKSSEPLVIDGRADLTISGLEIANPKGHGITIRNSTRIRIQDCKIGPCKEEAVNIYASEGITVTGNRFESASTGVYALDSRQIEVTGNRCLNVQGPFPRG